MTLTRLSIESYEREEHLPFSGFDNEAREKRDQVIDALERRLTQRTKTETLFVIRHSLDGRLMSQSVWARATAGLGRLASPMAS